MAKNQIMSLKFRYVFALLLLALLSVGSYINLQNAVNAQQGDAALVNISGRQRMLSQRIGLFATTFVTSQTTIEREAARIELESAIELFEQSHEVLLGNETVDSLDGFSEINSANALSENAIALYYGDPALDSQVQEYVSAARNLLGANESSLTLEQPNLTYILQEGPARLLGSLNEAVSIYQVESEANVANLQLRSGINLVVILIVLLLTGLFLFRPMDEAIQLNTEQLEAQNDLLLSQNQHIHEQAENLELALRVSKVMGRINDLDTMLKDAVNLLQERFNLYYAQVYLVDERNNTVILRAGAGDIGQRLVERGHRLPIGVGSINGRAAFERQTIVVSNTAASNSFRPNPLLPLTRSELALPLLIEDRLIGVLNLQSKVLGELIKEKTAVFEALAGQLAVAIANSGTFAKLVASQEEMTSRATRDNEHLWEDFFDSIEHGGKIGFHYENNLLVETPEIHVGVQKHSADVVVDNVKIGSIQIAETSDEHQWTANKQALLEGVAEQVARHVDNLRLLAETERYRHQAELVTRRMTQENWRDMLDVESSKYGYQYREGSIEPLHNMSQLPVSTEQPLLVNGEPIGFLAVDKPLDDEASQTLLSSVASQLSAHLESLRLSKQTEDALADTERLYRAGRTITEANSIQQLLTGLVNSLGKESGIGSASLFATRLDENGVLASIEQLGFWPEIEDYPIPNGTVFDLSSFTVSKYWRHGEMLLVENLEQDERIDEPTKEIYRQIQAKAFGHLPLRLGTEWVGVLNINWVDVQQFDDEHHQFYDALTRQAAVVLNNQFLLRQTQDALNETAMQAKRLQALNALGSRLSEAITLENVFDVLNEEVGKVIQFDRLSLALRSNENEKAFNLYDLTLMEAGNWPMKKMMAEGTYLGNSMDSNRVLVENDLSNFNLPDVESIKKMGIQAGLVGPLMINNKAIGTLNVSSKSKNAFNEQDVNIMLQMASLVSATIQSIRSLEESRSRARELALVNEIGQTVSLLNEAEEVFEAVLIQLQHIISVDAFMVGIYDHQTELMNFAYTFDDGERFEPYFDSLSAASRMRQVVETGEPIFISRSFEDAEAEKAEATRKGTLFGDVKKASASLMYVPLKIGETIAGCVTVQSYQIDAYSRSDLALLAGVATYVAISLEKVDLIARIQSRARRERLINEISGKIQQSMTVEGALQTAVRELGQTFQAKQTHVLLTEAGTPHNDHAAKNGIAKKD